MRPTARNQAWVVIRGLEPGVHRTWPDAAAQVLGVPYAIHKAYVRTQDAESVYKRASERPEAVIKLTTSKDENYRIIKNTIKCSDLGPYNPALASWYAAAESATTSKAKYIVVICGSFTGVFIDWLDCADAVHGIRYSAFKGFADRDEAWSAYKEAEEKDWIKGPTAPHAENDPHNNECANTDDDEDQ